MQAAIETSLQDSLKGTNYHLIRTSWNDAARTKGSCWGPNITDATLNVLDDYNRGTPVMVIRSQNFNEKIGTISTKDVAVMKTMEDQTIKPVTLKEYLVDDELNKDDVDTEMSIRFQAVFVPPNSHCVVKHFNYQATDDEAANRILLSTTQGTTATADAQGAVELFLENNGGLYTMLIEETKFGVGGSQQETDEERAALQAKGKASSEVLGPRAAGTRCNMLGVIQLPLVQTKPPARSADCLYAACFGAPEAFIVKANCQYEDEDMSDGFSDMPKSRVGKSSAGRLSYGRLVKSAPTLKKNVKRHATYKPTATYMIYYTVKDGVPSKEDVQKAVQDLDMLYGSCQKSEPLMTSNFVQPSHKTVLGGQVFPV